MNIRTQNPQTRTLRRPLLNQVREANPDQVTLGSGDDKIARGLGLGIIGAGAAGAGYIGFQMAKDSVMTGHLGVAVTVGALASGVAFVGAFAGNAIAGDRPYNEAESFMGAGMGAGVGLGLLAGAYAVLETGPLAGAAGALCAIPLGVGFGGVVAGGIFGHGPE